MAHLGTVLCAISAFSLPAPGAAQEEVRVRPVFTLTSSATHMAAVNRYAAGEVKKAKEAGRPIEPRVAVEGSTTLISLESVAICNRAIGCPILIFRDMAKPPVLRTNSFQNISIVYRGESTFAVLRDSGPDRECRLPPQGTAKCRFLPRNQSR